MGERRRGEDVWACERGAFVSAEDKNGEMFSSGPLARPVFSLLHVCVFCSYKSLLCVWFCVFLVFLMRCAWVVLLVFAGRPSLVVICVGLLVLVCF